MSSHDRPLVYLILGTPGAGRREVLADLITDGLVEGDRAVTALADTEAPSGQDARLGRELRWTWQDHAILLELPARDAEDPASGAGFSHLFFVTDGRRDPVDQIEALKNWVYSLEVDFARVITVVDCQLAQQHDLALRPWFDACVHFSDVVLLTRREGVPNKWISDFQTRFRDKFIPALFEFVKQGRVKNPAMVLEPQARRLTQIFEDDIDLEIARTLAPDAVIEFSGDESDSEDGEESPDDGEDGPAVDPYFERRQNGRRVIELPDVCSFLPTAPSTPQDPTA